MPDFSVGVTQLQSGCVDQNIKPFVFTENEVRYVIGQILGKTWRRGNADLDVVFDKMLAQYPSCLKRFQQIPTELHDMSGLRSESALVQDNADENIGSDEDRLKAVG